MDIIALFVFVVLQLLFIPLAIVGLILLTLKQGFSSKKLGVSSTAVSVFTARWAMDAFGLRKDTAAKKLNRILPNVSILGFWLVFSPNYIRCKISGKNDWYPSLSEPGKEGIVNMIIVRTAHIDNLINKSIDEVEQFVIMGAGFDTRCYGNIKNNNVKFFELDQAKTQRFKIEHLKKAGIDISDINYVEVDFSTEHWFDKLQKAGYDPNRKSIFLWEGVSLYLSEKDVKNTLKSILKEASRK